MKLLYYIRLFILVSFPILLGTTSIEPSNNKQMRQQLISAIGKKDGFKDTFHAQVWLLDMERRLKIRIPQIKERLTLLRLAHREAIQAKLAPELVLAVIEVESNFNRFAISEAGARGLMQIMPFWLKEIGHKEDNLMDIATNLRFGCTILRRYINREKGDLTRALARYNGSIGKAWYPDRVYKALHHWQ
ncbi:lytic transglycosylase domain-containing protein [Nitrosococcus watsonii]|uniref:Lytic transglycosylase catalytic n=1 Tax=Nitrosococcus watsoni (strain C-113) TaxID=105559 RepID=D8KBV5_NITWC|nr:lytic transglycosylase domain-containing protein [Nitrosococcus watsonii]ADJ27716.1 Lytic transglycosylase catalytic [Nitrosococcus watsonii C-113]